LRGLGGWGAEGRAPAVLQGVGGLGARDPAAPAVPDEEDLLPDAAGLLDHADPRAEGRLEVERRALPRRRGDGVARAVEIGEERDGQTPSLGVHGLLLTRAGGSRTS